MSSLDTRPRRSDVEIQRDVIASIGRDAVFGPAEIGVEVTDGIVTLSGTVSSREKAGAAMDVAAEVPGVRVIANKLSVESPTTGPDANERDGSEDAAIQADVVEQLNWDPRLRPASVGVEVDGGIVTLTGAVPTYAEVVAAGAAAADVPGARHVTNRVTVHPFDPDLRDDTDVSAAVRFALTWTATVPSDRIEALVREGIVTLRGRVGHDYQRKAAVDAVAALKGVRGIRDEIAVVTAQRVDSDIRHDLRRALARMLPRLNERIGFRVEDGTVTVSGWAKSLADRTAVERIAFDTPGVGHVIDRLIVTG